MKQNFTITSPAVKIILLIFIGIYIIILGFDVANNIGVHRFIDLTSAKPAGTMVLNHNVRLKSMYYLETVRINYSVQDPLEYFLLNEGNRHESLIGLLLELVIAVLSWIFLWKFDFANPFNPKSFIRSYTIFKFLIALFAIEWLAYQYSDVSMRNFLPNDKFRYVNAHNNGYWVQIIICTVIMYMYGNAVKNKEELELTI